MPIPNLACFFTGTLLLLPHSLDAFDSITAKRPVQRVQGTTLGHLLLPVEPCSFGQPAQAPMAPRNLAAAFCVSDPSSANGRPSSRTSGQPNGSATNFSKTVSSAREMSTTRLAFRER